jgi:cytidine deaminase
MKKSKLGKNTLLSLFEKARESIGHAYCPYSKFPVAAALLATTGKVYTGVNVENISYGLTMCAERNAVAKAVSQGDRHYLALALYTPTAKATTPCGACRQVLVQFSPDLPVYCICDSGEKLCLTSGQLLPHYFTSWA